MVSDYPEEFVQELFSAIAARRDAEPVGCGGLKRADEAAGSSASI